MTTPLVAQDAIMFQAVARSLTSAASVVEMTVLARIALVRSTALLSSMPVMSVGVTTLHAQDAMGCPRAQPLQMHVVCAMAITQHAWAVLRNQVRFHGPFQMVARSMTLVACVEALI